MKNLIWFRQDLRLTDNRALSAAAAESTEGLIALFIATPKTWSDHHLSGNKVDLLLRQLQSLKTDLAALNIPLKFLRLKTFDESAAAVKSLCQDLEITKVFANKQHLVDEEQRDKAVEEKLADLGISLECFDDLTLLPPLHVIKKDGLPYQVFTPYKRAWLSQINVDDWRSAKALKKQKSLSVIADEVPNSLPGFKVSVDTSIWPAGEAHAQKQLKVFCREKLSHYEAQRNFPVADDTSRLSPYLAIGVLSARQCLRAILDETGHGDVQEISSPGASTWLNELIWRDFYQSIAAHFPAVVKGEAFRPITDCLPWSDNQAHFKAWCDGETGFPLVDAGMRQLNQTGWMHNRLRMVVAMFLCKTLFIHWREGEQYFMQNLIDGDFSANNGGWQWSASTGTDAVPYFRIFNPTTQSERFDKTGDFIRHYCPELAELSAKEIHNPSLEARKRLGYPAPIVNYSDMRKTVIDAFKALSTIKDFQ